MIIERLLVTSGDNYNYLAIDEATNNAVVIDPLATTEVLDLIKKKGAKIKYIINTHSHVDHTGGNYAVKRHTGAKILAFADVPGLDEKINDRDEIVFGKSKLKAIHTPGHIADHICLLGDNLIFTGDTLFLSGAGSCYSGNPEDLYESFKNILYPLPNDTVVYPGHEYAVNNLKFAYSIEPGNKYIEEKIKIAEKTKMNISTLKEEKTYNPFLRCDIDAIKQNFPDLKTNKEIFLHIRELRNNW